MSAPSWLRSLWARRPRFHSRVAGPKQEEPKEMAPALIDEKWLVGNALVSSISGPYNAKGLHAVMEAVDAQPWGLWKILVARLIATARRYSKDLHEQSIYVQGALEEAETKRRAFEAEIVALKGEIEKRERDAKALAKERSEAITRAERAEKAEATMVEQVKAANEFRESMKTFTAKA